MADALVIWLAVLGGVIAGACACATAWLIWSTRRDQISYTAPPQQTPSHMIAVSPPLHAQPVPPYVVQQSQLQHHQLPPIDVHPPLQLEGHYPRLAEALGTWMQTEPDAVERVRIARDLGAIGGADSARALLNGVRTGVLTPTIAADNLRRGGFEAGIAVTAALADPEPRVRELATSLVGRAVPLQRQLPRRTPLTAPGPNDPVAPRASNAPPRLPLVRR